MGYHKPGPPINPVLAPVPSLIYSTATRSNASIGKTSIATVFTIAIESKVRLEVVVFVTLLAMRPRKKCKRQEKKPALLNKRTTQLGLSDGRIRGERLLRDVAVSWVTCC